MSNKTIYINVDQLLIGSNLFWENLIQLLKFRPLYLLFLPFWCLKRKAFLLNRLNQLIKPDIEYLPYNQTLLVWLKTQRQNGREVILMGHPNSSLLKKVAAHCDCFTKVDEAVTVSHSQEEIKSFLKKPFPAIKVWLKAIRVHQYAKNLLIFVPLLLGQFFLQVQLDIEVLLGFICFCLLASSVYILNDLLDLPSDRRHRTKHKRPFASGAISIPSGLLIMALFLALAVLLALRLSFLFQLCLLIYYALTLLYSFRLKRIPLIDVFTLSTLYTLRILAGLSLVGQSLPSWLVLFSMFFFTSLAFAKRYIELSSSLKEGISKLHGRGYDVEHLHMISQFGVASGYLSTLIFVLYLDSEKASQYYHQPKLLYLACPLILYWISRIWLKASEGQLHEDPVIYALHDKASYLLLAIMLVLIGLAIL